MIHNILMELEGGSLITTSNIFLLILFLCVISSKFMLKVKRHKNLPPSPPGLPLIGHLHLIKEPLHRILHNLTHNYGHILFLHLGKRNVLVVSSPSAVEECFTKNDITFANRPHTLSSKHLNYDNKTLKLASYGDHWRNLRRLTAVEVFSTNRLAFFAGIREEEVHRMVKQLFEESKKKQVYSKIELRSLLVEISFNIMLRMISGKRYYGKDAVTQEGKEFQFLMKEFIALEETWLNDYFPILQRIDFQGLEKRMVKLKSKLDNFFQNLLDEQRRKKSTSAGNDQRNMTLIEVMLDKQDTEPELYTNETIKGVIQAILIAGTETTSTTMEWALSLLIKHPEAMSKTRAEIDTHVGQDQLLNEADTMKLKYLQNVITETLRLYPAAPFLVPHESSNDCNIGGFDIPGGTTLLVNLWTLQRDPEWWKDPTRFVPERFEGGRDHGGEIYNMIPFGIGRRSCPGAVLAKRVMGLVLGALVQSFEWDKIGDEEINMEEGMGITIPRAEPLVALCKPRQSMIHVLSNI